MKFSQIVKNPENGLIVEIVNPGSADAPTAPGVIVEEKTSENETGHEKHLPVVSGDEKGVFVKVGSIPHPMDEDHYIEWIEVVNGAYINRKFLKPGEKPEVCFYVPMQQGLVVRAYCNKHGLWRV